MGHGELDIRICLVVDMDGAGLWICWLWIWEYWWTRPYKICN